jgi:electron transfer flavoprotein alpha subunit
MNSKHSGIWILAEQKDGLLNTVSYELLNWASSLAEKRRQPLTALVFGDQLDESELRQLIERGADRVLHINAPSLAVFQPDPFSACLIELINREKPEILLAAATTTGRTLLPYVAGKLHAGLTADCTNLDIEPETGLLLQTRPAAGGNIMATIKTPNCRPQMATVRPHALKPAPPKPGHQGEIQNWNPPVELLASRTRRLSFTPSEEELGVQDADLVVAAGRGFKKADNLSLLRRLAKQLGGAAGASREVVDRGWMPYSNQIGLSGKTVSPKVYIAAGVSGAIQHLAGMQTSDTIIAINSDPEAPIFQYSELGVCGDLFTILPLLSEKIAVMQSEENNTGGEA